VDATPYLEQLWIEKNGSGKEIAKPTNCHLNTKSDTAATTDSK
jgi:hypothetical protein